MSLKARIARLEATTPPAGRPPELVVSDPRTGITVLGYPGDFASVDDALDLSKSTSNTGWRTARPMRPCNTLRIAG